MDKKAFGERLKRAREERGLTQEGLAELVDYSPDHISVVERGVQVPRLDKLVEISNALNVSIDGLLGNDLTVSSTLQASFLSSRLAKLPYEKQKSVLTILESLIKEFEMD